MPRASRSQRLLVRALHTPTATFFFSPPSPLLPLSISSTPEIYIAADPGSQTRFHSSPPPPGVRVRVGYNIYIYVYITVLTVCVCCVCSIVGNRANVDSVRNPPCEPGVVIHRTAVASAELYIHSIYTSALLP